MLTALPCTTGARTDDGLAIYSVEELNIGRGGGKYRHGSHAIVSILIIYITPKDTPECPFDCACCF